MAAVFCSVSIFVNKGLRAAATYFLRHYLCANCEHSQLNQPGRENLVVWTAYVPTVDARRLESCLASTARCLAALKKSFDLLNQSTVCPKYFTCNISVTSCKSVFCICFSRGQTGTAACTFYPIQGPVSPGARRGQTMGSG